MAGKKKKGKKPEGKGTGEDTSAHNPSETRSGKQYQPHEDEQQGTRVPQSGPPIGKFPPLRTSGELPTAQDASDEPHTAASCGELQVAETAQGTGDDWISELCAKLSATADLDEEPQWDLYGWVQKESHPTWKDTSSGKREFDSEWDDWTYERRCNDEALSGDTFNEELWAWLQHLIAQSNMTEEERRRLTWAVRELRRADYIRRKQNARTISS